MQGLYHINVKGPLWYGIPDEFLIMMHLITLSHNQCLASLKKTTFMMLLFTSTNPPRILRVTPTGGATVGVHNTSVLTCSAEGNPLPKYQWLQKLSTQQVI